MIRYSTPFADIEKAVNREKPTWHKRAAARTQLFTQSGGYADKQTVKGKDKKLSDFWGDVKPVFMALQYGKCIFCETPLEAGKKGLIQWDLEHFRPKGNVRMWKPPNPDGYNFPLGDAMPGGYYLLAYHLGNYAAACKTCNSPYKSDYFPIAGKRVIGGASPEACQLEQAYLIYPLGNTAEDPEEHITFHGVKALPKNDSRRGQVMIDFFGLNRDGLQALRARWLRHTVWNALRLALQGDSDALKTSQWLLSPAAPYSSCVRSFIHLYETEPTLAQSLIPVFDEIIAEFPAPQPI